ncbi:hypothetical protein Plhal304r1_c031g0099371 [Plasmopara halstedii]
MHIVKHFIFTHEQLFHFTRSSFLTPPPPKKTILKSFGRKRNYVVIHNPLLQQLCDEHPACR